MPSFVEYNSGTFTFSPDSGTTVTGPYTIYLYLSDGVLQKHFTFNVKVIEIPIELEPAITEKNSTSQNSQASTIKATLKIIRISNNGFARVKVIGVGGD